MRRRARATRAPPRRRARAAPQVRVSIKVKQLDEMDSILANKFSRVLMQRADNFIVLRRKPMPVSRARRERPRPARRHPTVAPAPCAACRATT